MPIVKQSRYSFSQTCSRLVQSISDAGSTIFATIDQSAAAQGVGLTLRPTTLLIFGNPKAGTVLMSASPLVALELPLKMLVWEEDGAVRVAYSPLSELATGSHVHGVDALIGTLDTTLANLSDSIT